MTETNPITGQKTPIPSAPPAAALPPSPQKVTTDLQKNERPVPPYTPIDTSKTVAPPPHPQSGAPALPAAGPVAQMQSGMMQPGAGMMQPGMMQPGMMQPGMMQPGMMQPGMMPMGMMGMNMLQAPAPAPAPAAPVIVQAPAPTVVTNNNNNGSVQNRR